MAFLSDFGNDGLETPALTDWVVMIDDPGGTPANGACTFQSVLTLFNSSTKTFTNTTFDANATGNSLSNVETADIASGSRSGSDNTLITGTAGTNGNLVQWNADGDVVDASVAVSAVLVSSNIGTTVQGFDADTLKADVSDNLTVGFTSTSADLGTVTTTTTLNPATSNVQHYINGGAHTLNPPSANCTMLVDVTNNASAGAITTSCWDLVDGDSFTTTDTHKFRLFVSVNDGFSLLTVKALQ